MTNRYDLTELKTRLDIVEVARLCGLDPKKSGSSWVARCPAHPDSPEGRPNLAIHPTKGAKCFRCGWQADVIGLAVRAKGGDFGEVVDWLASLAGLAPQGEGKGRRSGSGLGYNGKGQGRDMYPKGEPLPPTLGPAVRIIGDPPSDVRAQTPAAGLVSSTFLQEAQDPPRAEPTSARQDAQAGDPGLVLRPPPAATQDDPRTWEVITLTFPADSPVVTIAGKWRRLDDGRIEASYTRPELVWAMSLTGYTPTADEWELVRQYEDDLVAKADRPTLRVRVFDAFLGYTVPVGEVPKAAAWLRDKKGLTDQTQAAAGLRWLADWEAADKGLKAAFDGETLKTFGLLTDKGRLRFWKHRLLFPFWVKGKPVFFAGRDIDAQGDDRRFDNLSGSVPCPYNADDLAEARKTGRPLFVCEGYTDCLTLTQSGRLAVALGGTQGFKPAWAGFFEGLDVYLAFDGDKAGREAAQKVADLFVSEGLPAPKIVKLPDGQDVTDFFTHQRSKTRV